MKKLAVLALIAFCIMIQGCSYGKQSESGEPASSVSTEFSSETSPLTLSRHSIFPSPSSEQLEANRAAI